jgi:hypothetical protein
MKAISFLSYIILFQWPVGRALLYCSIQQIKTRVTAFGEALIVLTASHKGIATIYTHITA